MERFWRVVDAHDGVIFTGTSDDPVDDGSDNFEPGIYEFIDVAQTDDLLGRD
jgi:hypothetical protein